MKTLLLLAGAALMSSVAYAATCGSLTPSADNTLGYYITNNVTCTVGDLQFSNFGYVGSANPSGDVIPAVDITVDATGGDGLTFNPGMSIETQNPANTSSFQDSDISFTVTAIDGVVITQMELSFNGAFTANGTSSVSEQYCLGTTVPVSTPCSHPSAPITVSNPPYQNPTHVTFAPVTTLTVQKDINVTSGLDTSGGNPSTAYISSVSDTFSIGSGVPEPGTLILLGCGLVALGLARKRRGRH